jgi:hypothetical protein
MLINSVSKRLSIPRRFASLPIVIARALARIKIGRSDSNFPRICFRDVRWKTSLYRFPSICANKLTFVHSFVLQRYRTMQEKASRNFVLSSPVEGAQNTLRSLLCYGNALIREYENLPGVPCALVDYLRSGVGCPDSRIVTTPKGTKICVCLPQQSSLKHTRPYDGYATAFKRSNLYKSNRF